MASQLFMTFARNASRLGWLELFERETDTAAREQDVANWNNPCASRSKSAHMESFHHETRHTHIPSQASARCGQAPANSIGIALAHYRLKHAERTTDRGAMEDRY